MKNKYKHNTKMILKSIKMSSESHSPIFPCDPNSIHILIYSDQATKNYYIL